MTFDVKLNINQKGCDLAVIERWILEHVGPYATAWFRSYRRNAERNEDIVTFKFVKHDAAIMFKLTWVEFAAIDRS